MDASRRRPIITLTTDFGLSDHYVGAMKGVILSRCPDAQVVDISHNVAAFSIWTAAYTIDQAAPYFPPGTVHILVIDPGVGTTRRPILLQALGHYFVAPDNGVLSRIFRRDPNAAVREINNCELFLPEPSSTFHGRDVFAPVGAALAAGTAQPEDVGPVMKDLQILDRLDMVDSENGSRLGAVLSVDHFGNVITNFPAALASDHFQIRTPKRVITNFHRTFAEAPPDVCFAYAGSSGYLELGMNKRSAAEFLHLRPGDVIEFETQE